VLSTHLVLMVFMFGGNTLVCLAVLALHFTGARYRQGGGSDAQDARATLHANVALLVQQWRSTAVCVALGIVGTLLTYQVYQVNSVAVVQLLRCLGPAFTATLAFGFLRELLTLPQQVCLIVSLVGSMVATASDASFTPVACLVGVAMNTVFSLRNIQLRFLVVTLPQGVSKDLIIVLLTLAANVLGFALAFLFNLALYVQGTVDLASVSAIWHQRDTLSTITSNALYNLASNMVLSEAAAVSHGMLELLKRVTILLLVHVFGAWGARHVEMGLWG
jgi:hypothetical protein